MKEYNNQLRDYAIPIEEYVNVLKGHLKDIDSVTTWAELMGYSRSYFSTSFSECFDESPFECLCRIRYKRLQEVILKHPNETSRAIAQRLGLTDEQALYKFLNRCYDTNFTEMRKELLTQQMNNDWINIISSLGRCFKKPTSNKMDNDRTKGRGCLVED